MLTSKLFVSIIVPVYNDVEGLHLCLTALESQTYPSDYYEVIVIDNNSTEDIASLAQQYSQVKLAYESQQGSYAARNKGIAIAQGDILGFTDSDCITDSHWIEEGVKALQETLNCGLVAGKIDFYFQDPEHPTAAELYDSTRFLQQERFISELHFGATANVFTYKAVFEKVGLFNDSLKSGGDQEWGNRVFKHGYTQTYAEHAKILHPARSTLKELRRKLRRVFQGEFEISNRQATPPRAFIYETLIGFKPSFRYILQTLTDNSIGNLKYRISFITIYLIIKYERLITQAQLYFGLSSDRPKSV